MGRERQDREMVPEGKSKDCPSWSVNHTKINREVGRAGWTIKSLVLGTMNTLFWLLRSLLLVNLVYKPCFPKPDCKFIGVRKCAIYLPCHLQ